MRLKAKLRKILKIREPAFPSQVSAGGGIFGAQASVLSTTRFPEAVDGAMQYLIEMWLKAPGEQTIIG